MPYDSHDDFINDVLSQAESMRAQSEEPESLQRYMEQMHPLAMLRQATSAHPADDDFCHPILLVIVERHYDTEEKTWMEHCHIYQDARARIGQCGELTILQRMSGAWRMVAEYPTGQYCGWEREGAHGDGPK